MAPCWTSIRKCLQFCMEPSANGQVLCLEFLAGSELVLFFKSFQKPPISNSTMSFSNSEGFSILYGCIWEDVRKIARGIVAFFLGDGDENIN